MAKATRRATWEWRSGGPKPPIEAAVFAEELEKIAGDNPLELVEPDAIWQAARKRSNPMHPCFDWALEAAAQAHWREQARALVGRLHLIRVDVEHSPATSTRGWWSVVIEKQRGYAKQDRVMSDRDLRLQVLADVKRDLHQVLAKYFQVLSFGRVIPKLQEIIEELQDEIDRLEMESTARHSRSGTSPGDETHPT